jgi:glycolate oxidase FAD binding subunit
MPAFEPYLDPVDLSACVTAETQVSSLNARLAAEGAYWPLEGSLPLGGLFLGQRYCPRSFRYGGLGDNVLGLAWRLPNGTRVDLGGRVVKNVAGFELLRFLCASQGRFGRPELLVLRLRPKPEAERVLKLRGPLSRLRDVARAIRASSWTHAIDALDLEADTQSAGLILAFSGKPAVLPLFDAQCHAWAEPEALDLEPLASLPARSSAPWARVQAPLDEIPLLAAEWLQRYGGRLNAHLGQGYLNIEAIDTNEEGCLQGLHELHQRLSALGGHCEHPSLEPEPSAPQARWEAEWLKKLEAVR